MSGEIRLYPQGGGPEVVGTRVVRKCGAGAGRVGPADCSARRRHRGRDGGLRDSPRGHPRHRASRPCRQGRRGGRRGVQAARELPGRRGPARHGRGRWRPGRRCRCLAGAPWPARPSRRNASGRAAPRARRARPRRGRTPGSCRGSPSRRGPRSSPGCACRCPACARCECRPAWQDHDALRGGEVSLGEHQYRAVGQYRAGYDLLAEARERALCLVDFSWLQNQALDNLPQYLSGSIMVVRKTFV